jgi:hypothetical protein
MQWWLCEKYSSSCSYNTFHDQNLWEKENPHDSSIISPTVILQQHPDRLLVTATFLVHGLSP